MEQSERQANAKIMQLKGALMEVTSVRGWRNVTQFAEALLQNLKDKSFMEADATKAEGLRRDARGAMLFWQELTETIERTKSLDTAPSDDSFLDIVTD